MLFRSGTAVGVNSQTGIIFTLLGASGDDDEDDEEEKAEKERKKKEKEEKKKEKEKKKKEEKEKKGKKDKKSMWRVVLRKKCTVHFFSIKTYCIVTVTIVLTDIKSYHILCIVLFHITHTSHPILLLEAVRPL